MSSPYQRVANVICPNTLRWFVAESERHQRKEQILSTTAKDFGCCRAPLIGHFWVPEPILRYVYTSRMHCPVLLALHVTSGTSGQCGMQAVMCTVKEYFSDYAHVK